MTIAIIHSNDDTWFSCTTARNYRYCPPNRWTELPHQPGWTSINLWADIWLKFEKYQKQQQPPRIQYIGLVVFTMGRHHPVTWADQVPLIARGKMDLSCRIYVTPNEVSAGHNAAWSNSNTFWSKCISLSLSLSLFLRLTSSCVHDSCIRCVISKWKLLLARRIIDGERRQQPSKWWLFVR